MNPKVDEFISNLKNWKSEMEKLRSIILETGLQEDFKWMHPCYTLNNANIVLIHGFKDYCALLFYKGALLNDEKNLLIQQTENVQSGRQIRFNNIKEIVELESTLKEYIYEAIEVEKAGLKVELKKHEDFELPEELISGFDKDSKFKNAFEALTPGRQRAYILHFSGSKNAATRENRIENYKQRILNGKGINDCVCGLSKRFPVCDGSHKGLVNR
ncbi:DUF1801 domain-containing protein [Pedobacter psychrophilus]|uniref:DUF1801 domain-containing protein n=1 Tax=Pedobacter psychrophilus TaxID=1826909 RepID=UPI00083B9C27|nr:DUF1801 domain-containing protein [Pedobacter psychrophilus]